MALKQVKRKVPTFFLRRSNSANETPPSLEMMPGRQQRASGRAGQSLDRHICLLHHRNRTYYKVIKPLFSDNLKAGSERLKSPQGQQCTENAPVRYYNPNLPVDSLMPLMAKGLSRTTCTGRWTYTPKEATAHSIALL